MRWNYYSPTKDAIVSDGKNLWYYNEQENQVMESSLEELSSDTTSTTLLSGLGNIKELFDAKFIYVEGLKKQSGYLLELSPKDKKEGENYNKVIVNVDKRNTLVDTIYLFDPFGNQTKISLNKLEINKKISDKIFKYKPPKGVEIVKMPAPKQ